MRALYNIIKELKRGFLERFSLFEEFFKECVGGCCRQETVNNSAWGMSCDIFGGVEMEGFALFGEGFDSFGGR